MLMADRSEILVHAFIQAGGRSSRMGTDKAWLEINGRSMVEYVLAAAEPVAASLSIVINQASPNANRYRELAARWNARLLYDLHDHKGPLGGINTALTHCGEHESALILACDLPFITTEFLSFLCKIHQAGTQHSALSTPHFITVPTDQEGRLQPLTAIYDQACLPAIEEMLAADRLKVDRLFEKVPTGVISFDAIADFGGSQLLFHNMNSSEDLQLSITKTQAEKFRLTLEQFDDNPVAHPGVHPKLIKAQREAIASQLETLRQDIEAIEGQLKTN
ncbi:MAG: molybdenum cofactor guanylyltransferase [Acidobacteria bacterium]|nr:molybdenum cofactor guanylyltransferase [Acidobacteriota bacterium]